MTTSNDSVEEKKDISSDNLVTKKDLRKMFWRSLSMEFSWHYERQMHMGYTHMMEPVLKKLYGGNKEKYTAALKRHMEFFNITPALSPFVGGVSAAMEEKNAKSDDFDVNSINAVKASLMGPLSGIGDSIFLGTIRILGIGVGTSLALKGSILGPILFLLIYNIPQYFCRYFGVMKGYKLGTDFLGKVQKSGLMDKLMLAAGILGVMVVGAMTCSMVTASTPIQFGVGKAMTKLQDILDGIFPGMMSLGFFGLFYYLTKKKVNVIWLILGTIAFGIFCAAFGILSAGD